MINRIQLTVVAALLAAVLAPTALGDEKADLKARFEARYPKLQQLKSEGKLGETFLGYVDAVKPEFAGEDEVKKMIGEENNDRRRLYEIIAQEQKTTVDHVGRRNAERNFKMARSDDWLRIPDNSWVKKKDYNG